MTNSQSPQTELAACPFCGGRASSEGHVRYSPPLADANWADGSEITEAFYVNCMRCGVSNAGSIAGYQTKAEAIERWNTRPSPLVDTGEALREALLTTRQLVVNCCDSGFTDKDALEALYRNNGAITAALAAHPKPEENQ